MLYFVRLKGILLILLSIREYNSVHNYVVTKVCTSQINNSLKCDSRFPKVTLHVYMAVGLEGDAFVL